MWVKNVGGNVLEKDVLKFSKINRKKFVPESFFSIKLQAEGT